MVHWIKHPASSPRTMRDTLIYTVSALLIELCHRPGSTPKPLFSTKQLNRFESTEIPGKLVAGRLNPTLARHQLTFYHGPLIETNSVAWLVKAA